MKELKDIKKRIETATPLPTDLSRLMNALETVIVQRNDWIRQANDDQSPMDVESYVEDENEALAAVLRGED